jgi:hypothetical protein
MGRPYNEPVNHLSYVENFLYMLDHLQVRDTATRPLQQYMSRCLPTVGGLTTFIFMKMEKTGEGLQAAPQAGQGS